MRVNSVKITKAVESLLWSNYDLKSKKPVGGLALAGMGNDKVWYSNTALGDGYLYKLLLEEEKFSKLFGFLYENSDNICLIPWMQHKGKYLDQGITDFINTHMMGRFPGVIIEKPTAQIGKRFFVVEYYALQDLRMYEQPIETINVKDMDTSADDSIKRLMNFWIDECKEEKGRMIKVPDTYLQ